MGNVSKFVIDGTDVDVKDSTARSNIGTLSSLTTTVKTDLVSAINEVASETSNVSVTYASATETITITTPQ